MVEKQDGNRGRLKSWRWVALVAVILLIALAFVLGIFPLEDLPPVIGDIVQDVAQADTPTPSPTPVTPTLTETPSPTSTSTPTVTTTFTPSPSTTPTSTPRILTWDEFYEDLVHRGDLRDIVSNGFYYYDGEEWSDTYPCPDHSCIMNANVEYDTWMIGYEEHPDLDYWCEYMCQGVFQGFGHNTQDMDVWVNHRWYVELYGDSESKFYTGFFCPQFSEPLDGPDPTCNNPAPPPSCPPDNLEGWPDGWPEDTRDAVIEKWLMPILTAYDGDNVPYPCTYYYRKWEPEVIASLTDAQICDIIADNHYYLGFPEYRPVNSERDHYLNDEYRLRLRDDINSDIGVPKGDIPALCPGFLGMISPYGLPDFPYTDIK